MRIAFLRTSFLQVSLLRHVAAAAVTISLCGVMPAQDQPTLVPPVREFRLPPRVGVFGEARLSLDQALAMALANNNDIDASKIDREEADYALLGAHGLFDPTIGGASAWQKQVLPVASALGGSATGAVLSKLWQTDPTLNGSVPWFGGSYHTDFASQRASTNNTFVTLNPQYPAALNFQYTQPLSRNLRYDVNRHSLDVARKNQSLSQEQFRQRVMQIVLQTEQAYWELAYAYNNLQVQLEAVEIARQQDESNRRQEREGLLAPIDVVAAQTQLAGFELNAYTAQAALTTAENALKLLILADRASAMWASSIVPTTPADMPVPVVPLADAVAEALASRPETAAVKIAGEINQSDAKFFRDQIKPQVDLVASYTRQGLAGVNIPPTTNFLTSSFGPLVDRLNALSAASGLPPVAINTGSPTPPLLIGDYGQSLNNLWAGNFPTTQFQLRVALPIRNRTAEANLSRAIAETRRIQNQKDQVEQAIEAGVRNAMQAMDSAALRRDAARVQRESAEEQYNSEQRQFRAGTSTLFLVQQRQSTMIAARSQERRAESDLGQAIAAFELAAGTILRQHNIQLQ
ncbi:MAG TPA: TolC family protein [Bryobacteraceae bacterium]|nr:TolC family protein [Bryobacteraceae bacterium]